MHYAEKKIPMRQRKVSLTPLDALIHYSLAVYFVLPILILAGYYLFGRFGLFGFSSLIDLSVVMTLGILLSTVSLFLYSVQRAKLRFQFIRTSTTIDESKQLIKEIAKGEKWVIRSFKNNIYTIKTNPGFVNQAYGQHITIHLVDGGVLVNSIFDTNKGSWLITFGSNQKNIDSIKRAVENRVAGKEADSSPHA